MTTRATLKSRGGRIWRWVGGAFVVGVVLGLALGCWVWWSAWPEPIQEPLFADADAIVILGGGDDARWQKGLEVARAYPQLPVVVTGDDGYIVAPLAAHGLAAPRVVHEEAATSTVENAKFTGPLLDRIGARRVILVTNWFHAPRSLAMFRKYQVGGGELEVICYLGRWEEVQRGGAEERVFGL